jgi:hypothetical protein
MITGFNTDIEHAGRIYHIQTEDKGLDNPVVETLIYCGGEIVTSRRSSYESLADSGYFSEEQILGRMEAQHQALIREVHNGCFDGEGPLPFGHGIVSNRSLDEVVLDFLAGCAARVPIQVELIDHQVLYEGTRPTLRMKVVEEDGGQPVSGATVTVRLVSASDESRELFSASTDDEGFLEASFEIPEGDGDELAIVCEADVVGVQASVRQPVSKTAPQASPTP